MLQSIFAEDVQMTQVRLNSQQHEEVVVTHTVWSGYPLQAAKVSVEGSLAKDALLQLVEIGQGVVSSQAATEDVSGHAVFVAVQEGYDMMLINTSIHSSSKPSVEDM